MLTFVVHFDPTNIKISIYVSKVTLQLPYVILFKYFLPIFGNKGSKANQTLQKNAVSSSSIGGTDVGYTVRSRPYSRSSRAYYASWYGEFFRWWRAVSRLIRNTLVVQRLQGSFITCLQQPDVFRVQQRCSERPAGIDGKLPELD